MGATSYSKLGANYLDAERWQDVQRFKVTLIDEPPKLGEDLDTPLAPNQVYGWYNDFSDMVELFWSSSDGLRVIRIQARME